MDIAPVLRGLAEHSNRDKHRAATVHAITSAHRRLDATTSSGELVEPVAAHLRMATGMQAKIWDPLSGQAMAAAVSEVAGLAGTWRALDRAEAAVGRVAAQEPPPWPWVFPCDARKLATHRLTCAVRLRRPDIAYAAVADLPVSMPAGHHKQGALVLLDLASAHVQAQ